MEVFTAGARPETRTNEDAAPERELVTILPRRNITPKSHYYCLTSEGPKALYDPEIYEQLMSEEELLVEYQRGDVWAYPCGDDMPVRSRIEGRVRRLVAARTKRLIKAARHDAGGPRAEG